MRLRNVLSAIAAALPLLAIPPAAEAGDTIGSPHLVLVSIDGLRWDLPDRVDTPALDRMAAEGLKAEALQPVFPTLTFPNHFAIATGRLPAAHGLVSNKFPNESRTHWYDYKDRDAVQDGRWYLAEPIWVTAERAGLPSAAYYFVGTEADVGGQRPTRWYPFDAAVSGEARVDQVLAWLREPATTRPRLVTLYFEEFDEHAHWYGPESTESRRALRRVDAQLGRLLDGIAELPHGEQVYVLLVSDHGTDGYAPGSEPFVLERIADLDGIRSVEGGPYVHLYLDDRDPERAVALRDTINDAWDCGQALLPGDAPATWGLTENPRFPDLIVQASVGCAVLSSERMRHKITAGDHGWAPESPQMRGVFYAVGPRIAPGSRTGILRVTDIHPMMLSILGLENEAPPSGSASVGGNGAAGLLLPATVE